MTELITKSSLSDSQRRLVELMQQINFGRIEDLQVRAGEPFFDPAPRVIQKLKIGGENGARPEADSEDFCLKHQVIELLEAISRLHDGEVLTVEVRHGLPFSAEIEHWPGTDGGRPHA